MGAVGILGKIFGAVSGSGTAGGSVIKDIFAGIDSITTTDAEKETLKQKALGMYMDDVKSARTMYMADSSLQKIFALVFLITYIALTALLVWGLWVYVKSGVLDVPEWVVGFISSLWGGLSAKLNTIVDFLFGSSKGSQDKNMINENLLTNLNKKENG
jgi:hypothetical protein